MANRSEKDPAMLLYTSDFLTETMEFTDKEVGKYIRILCLLHQRERLSKTELKKLCGAVPDCVLNKLSVDEDGRYYDEAIEAERLRRKAYREKRRENIAKRWAKNSEANETEKPNNSTNGENTSASKSEYKCIDNEDTSVPHIYTELNCTELNCTELNLKENEENEEKENGEVPREGSDAEAPRVMSYYMSRINPMPSRQCSAELLHYTRQLGAEVVLHALQIAQDERKTSWSYIKAILRRYSQSGVKSLEDVLRAERERMEAQDAQRRRQQQSSGSNPFLEMLQEETEASGER